MSFEDKELSQQFGAPLEYVKFTVGTTVYRVTGMDHLDTIDEPGGDTDVEYAPVPGFNRSSMDFSQEDTAQNIEIEIATSHAVGQLFIGPMPATPVGVIIYQKHRSDPEIIVGFTGTVVSSRHASGLTTLVAAPANQNLRRLVPSLVCQSQCNWALYGPGCDVDKAPFTDAVTFTTIAGRTITSTDFAAQDDDWYTNGWLELPDGQKRYVLSHVGDTIILLSPFPASIISGQTGFAVAGCMRDEGTCFTKFNNLDNHLGFPRVPGRNPHGGGAIA